MNPRHITYIAVAAFAAAAIGAGATYAIQQQRMDRLEERIGDLSKDRASLEASLSAAEESLSAQPDAQTPDGTSPDQPPTNQAAPKREFAFIKNVTFSGTGGNSIGTIVADYAQFLTGKAAADAAAKAGDESPPPNDYYIVNANPQLRTLKVAPNATVRLTTNPDGTADPAGYESTYEAWANHFAAPSDENEPIRRAGYWLTLENGIVVAVAEQFVP